MSYANPLHPPVPTIKKSPFTSLNYAASSTLPSNFITPCRRRIPQKQYANSKFGSATALHPTITFDYAGYSNQGVPMCELAGKSMVALSHMIVNPNDLVLAKTGQPRINFRIHWPGYEHLDWIRSIEITAHGHMTRAQLGAAIALNYARFFDKARTERPTSSDYSIGPSAIRFDQLILIALHNVADNVWQAEIAADFRY